MERAGVPRSVAMQLTGHKTEAVYRRYAIVAEADLAVGVGRLASLHASSRTFPAQLALERVVGMVDETPQAAVNTGPVRP